MEFDCTWREDGVVLESVGGRGEGGRGVGGGCSLTFSPLIDSRCRGVEGEGVKVKYCISLNRT